jgi:hypothetical protein
VSDQDLERRDFLRDQCSSGEGLTRQEAERERVRVLDNDRFFDLQVEGAPE